MLHPHDTKRPEPGMMVVYDPLVINDLIEMTQDGPPIHPRSRNSSEPLIIDATR
jgi:hypothetical protein